MLAYSLLMNQLKQSRAKHWALCRLTTIGEACQAILRETLQSTLAWAIEQITEKSRSYDHMVAQLCLTSVCKSPVRSKGLPGFVR